MPESQKAPDEGVLLSPESEPWNFLNPLLDKLTAKNFVFFAHAQSTTNNTPTTYTNALQASSLPGSPSRTTPSQHTRLSDRNAWAINWISCIFLNLHSSDNLLTSRKPKKLCEILKNRDWHSQKVFCLKTKNNKLDEIVKHQDWKSKNTFSKSPRA